MFCDDEHFAVRFAQQDKRFILASGRAKSSPCKLRKMGPMRMTPRPLGSAEILSRAVSIQSRREEKVRHLPHSGSKRTPPRNQENSKFLLYIERPLVSQTWAQLSVGCPVGVRVHASFSRRIICCDFDFPPSSLSFSRSLRAQSHGQPY